MPGVKDLDGEPAIEEDKNLWLTRHRAAAKLGISPRTLDRMIQQGELHPEYIDGVRRFSPKELDQCQNEAGIEAELRETLNTVNDSLKIAQNHAKEAIALVLPNAQKIIDALSKDNDILRLRNGELLDKHAEIVGAYEKILSEANEREIKRAKALAVDKRLDQGWDMVLKQAPQFFDQVLRSGKAKRLIKSLDSDQLEALKRSEFLTPEQLELIIDIRNEAVNQNAKPVETPSTGDSEKGNNSNVDNPSVS